MLNEFLLLNAVKTVLTADVTLSNLLNKKDSGKVLLGPSRPTVAGNPMIQLFCSAHQVEEEAKWDTAELTVRVYASDILDLADVEEISTIVDRVVTLLDELPPALVGHIKYNIGLTAWTPVGPAPDSPDGTKQHYQEVRFNFRGIKT